MAIQFGIWNVQTLYKTGSMNCMPQEIERNKVNVVALQEIRRSDMDSISTDILQSYMESVINNDSLKQTLRFIKA